MLSRFGRVQFFGTPWTIAHQAPLSMRFSGQEHWSGLPCPPPGDLPNTGIKPRSPTLQADSFLTEDHPPTLMPNACFSQVSGMIREMVIFPLSQGACGGAELTVEGDSALHAPPHHP